MRNLIGLFFIFGALTAYSQNNNNEEVAENKLVSVEATETVPTALPDALETKANGEKLAVTPTIKNAIINSFKMGKTELIAKYFPANIDINVLGKSNLYSKPQAKQVLSTFFTQNKAENFAIVHEGESNGTKYFIGSYTSAGVKYRVTVDVKTISGSDQISSISIER